MAMTLPHFLCIGAQKAGTTWLYHNLRSHPAVWMPPLKEIFYFCGFAVGEDGAPAPPSRLPLALQLLLPANGNLRRLVGDAWRAARRPRQRPASPRREGAGAPAAAPPPPPSSAGAPRVVGAAPRAAGHAAAAAWCLRYALLPRTDRWYAALFRPGPGQISGDITPYYANLGEARVARIHALLPRAKIIYLLRSPVERLWSEAGMAARRGGGSLAAADAEPLRAYFRARAAARLTDYVANHRTWRRFYPEEQMHVGFFDELAGDARTFLRRICRFLGIDDSDAAIAADAEAVRNPGREPAIPAEWARFLAELLGPQIEALHAHFAHPCTARWLADARDHAAGVSAWR